MLGIGGDRFQRLDRRPEQDVVDDRLVLQRHRYALPRSDPRRDYKAAIAAKIIGVSGSAQQRCGSLRRLLSTGVRGSTRELQDDGWHIDLRSCELVFLDDALLTICLAFDAVLRPAPRFGEQAND